MVIYYILIGFWICTYFCINELKRKRAKMKMNFRLITSIIMGISLFLVMALRHYSVGVDTKQYLYRYNYVIYPLNSSIFMLPEWGFHGFAAILKNLGIGNQGYIIIVSFIITILFTRFFYKYSQNIFLSFYLHLTIGLFTMSLSGVRQTIAVGIVLLAFDCMVKNKLIPFVIYVLIAYYFHNSAICFLPVYFLRNIKITRKKGFVLWLITVSIIFLINPIMNLIKPILSSKYLFYLSTGNSNPANPLVIIVALAISIVCLFFMKGMDKVDEKTYKLSSLFFLMSLINSLANVLSLNVSIISRLSYYFLTFNVVLIPMVINGIREKELKYIAFIFCLILPFIQFAISTPNGTLQIDKYMFFWELTGY